MNDYRFPTVDLDDRDQIIAQMISAADAEAAAAALNGRAQDNDRERIDSFDRCDTDGFVSQWAHGLNAQKDYAQARIVLNGGRWNFPALFTLDGKLIDARPIDGRFGRSWLTSDGRWLNDSNAADPNRRIKADAAKGFYLGTISAPAVAEHRGGSMTSVTTVTERVDDRSWDGVIVVDNGHTLTTVPTPAEVAQGKTFTDEPWHKPLCDTSVDYITTPKTVTAAYIADPAADPAEAVDAPPVHTPFWGVPRVSILGTAVKYTRATSPTGDAGWHVTDADGQWDGQTYTRKGDAMAALKDIAAKAMDTMANAYGG